MRKAILILFTMIAPNLFSQTDAAQDFQIVNHQVMMGETVRMLSKKYLVPPAEIYRLNKFAVDGIKQGMVLQIPVPVKEPAPEPVQSEQIPAEESQNAFQEAVEQNPSPAASAISHKVASGETLSGLGEQYGTSVSALKEANPKVAKRGLRAGETINIPVEGGVVPPNANASAERIGQSGTENAEVASETVTHTVQPGETLFGLAKKYNVDPSVIKQLNPSVARKGLQAGQVIKIKGN